MQASNILRGVLDLLDAIDKLDKNYSPPTDVSNHVADDVSLDQDSEQTRFRQILAMLDQEKNDQDPDYANRPDEVVSDLDSVTTHAGGGMNGRKHPADIRVKDPRGYEPWQT